jgi:uncharacterized protein YkwD
MTPALSGAAIFLTAACGGAGGSTVDVSQNFIPIEDLPQIAISEAPSATFESMLNNVRSNAAISAGPVTYNSLLGQAARRHANDMHANDFFDHEGSDGSNIGKRVSDTGYQYSYVGENIAWGQQSEAAALADWQSSTEGHKENNELVRHEHFALAKAGSGQNTYWVLVLADPL